MLKPSSKKEEKKRLETKAVSPAQVPQDHKSPAGANGQDQHHSALLGVPPASTKPENKFRHDVRNPAKVSSLQRNRKARLAIPPASSLEWTDINLGLGTILGDELPISRIMHSPAQASISKLDELTYDYFFTILERWNAKKRGNLLLGTRTRE